MFLRHFLSDSLLQQLRIVFLFLNVALPVPRA